VGPELATRLLIAASRYGRLLQKWAVADWEQITFSGDQKAFRAAGYRVDIASDHKANASDHVLRERIHGVLREVPEVEVYVIATGDADFHETIKTLKEQGKTVILWALRDSIDRLYGDFLRGPEQIRIEWLDDLVFGDEEGSRAAAETT
jgi:hypothetical protein